MGRMPVYRAKHAAHKMPLFSIIDIKPLAGSRSLDKLIIRSFKYICGVCVRVLRPDWILLEFHGDYLPSAKPATFIIGWISKIPTLCMSGMYPMVLMTGWINIVRRQRAIARIII